MRFFILFFSLLLIQGNVMAEPSSAKVNVVSLRPYSGDVAYIQISSNTFCNTDVFAVDTALKNGKEMYATALAAATAGKKITVEVPTATGCAGWGTRLQSVTLFP